MKTPQLTDNLRQDAKYISLTLLAVVAVVGLGNLYTPNGDFEVGYTEISTECFGIEAGVCLGIQKRTHTTYNYNNYTEPEPGTENFYRRVESELMLRAYDVCNSSMNGMEWTSEVSYRNKTAAEWMKNENVSLLPCDQTFYHELKDSK